MCLIALCAWSCKSSRIEQSHIRIDSLQLHETREITYRPIPMSQTHLAMSAQTLRELPVGAGYHSRKGQAGLQVIKGAGDSLLITASCDSLQQQVIALTTRLERALLRQREHREQVRTSPTYSPLRWFACGLLLGLLIALWGRIKRLFTH